MTEHVFRRGRRALSIRGRCDSRRSGTRPWTQPDHARRACATALEMTAALAASAARVRAARVGRARHGRWGSTRAPRWSGTWARVPGLPIPRWGTRSTWRPGSKGLSKEYGVRVVIGEATREAAGSAFEYRFLDVVAVKGREHHPRPPCTSYWAAAGSLTPDAARPARPLSRGHRAVSRPPVARGGRALRWTSPRRRPTTGPSPSTAAGATTSSPDPPPPDWDGVYVALTK